MRERRVYATLEVLHVMRNARLLEDDVKLSLSTFLVSSDLVSSYMLPNCVSASANYAVAVFIRK